MEVFISKEIQEGLDAARRANLRKSSQLRIEVKGAELPVLRRWDNGFAIALEDAPRLRGLVELYDGSRHLFQCLITGTEARDGEMQYTFKRATPVPDRAPVDYEHPVHERVGLIGRARF